MRRLFLTIATTLVLMVAGFATPGHAGEDIRCTCYFEQASGYSAVGTRAACSTMTHKNMRGAGEHCEVSFGAAGAEERVASQLNISPRDLNEVAYKVTAISLQSLFARDPRPVSDPGYLRDAIPAFMRATYLREGAQIDEKTRADLDKQVVEFAGKYAETIAQVFQNKSDPFETKWQDRHPVTVTRGAVRFTYTGDISIVLVAVFFDPGNVR